MSKLYELYVTVARHVLAAVIILGFFSITAGQVRAQYQSASTYMEELLALEKHNANLFVAILLLQGESTHINRDSYTSLEVQLLKEAAYTTPYYYRYFKIMEAGCSYYDSTPFEDLEIDVLAQVRANAQWAEVEEKVVFLEDTLNRLSEGNRERALQLVSENVGLDAVSVGLRDYFLLAKESPELTISRFEIACERLPMIKEKYESGNNHYSESTFNFDSF